MRRPVGRRTAWRLLLPPAAAALLAAAACGGGDAEGTGTIALPQGMGMPQQPTVEPNPTPPAIPFSPATPRAGVTVAQSWPHDPQAFTQGLVVHDGVLYESTGLEGQTSVRQVELATGRVLRRVTLPRPYFGEGIAVLDGRLYQLTWKDGRAFVYDAATLAPLDTFTYQGEGWGLTTDGTVLYMSDGTPRLRVVDPDGFRVQRTIDVTEDGRPVPYLNELEWVKGELWANVWLTHLVARIDPATGRVLGYVDLSGLLTPEESSRVDVTNGIAYDAARDRLLVTGKLWPKLFAVRVQGN